MNIKTRTFCTADNKQKGLCIYNFEKLCATEAVVIRDEIEKSMLAGYPYIYIDAKEVTEADLSGINEIIHSNFMAQQNSQQLVFVYRKKSTVEKWVQTTSLDSFVSTAVLPAF